MVASSHDRLPELSEERAEGTTAHIYDGLKRLGGVPMVALLYRHLATIPGALEWTWATLSPALDAGALQEQAWTLTAQLQLQPLSTFPRPALRVLGVSIVDETAIRNILDAYNRSNSMNLLAVAYLKHCAQGVGSRVSEHGASRSWSPPALLKPLPSMVDPEQMSPTLVELIAFLRNHESAATLHIIPSLYRHLAHWPDFLALAAATLAPRFSDIAQDSCHLNALGEEAALRLALEFGRPSCGVALPKGAYFFALEQALDSFTGGIPKTMIIGTLLRGAMAGR